MSRQPIKRAKVDWRAHLKPGEAMMVRSCERIIERGRRAAQVLAALRNRAIQRAQRKAGVRR